MDETVPAKAATIERIEPPSWWIETKHPHITLLVTGTGLTRVRVASSHPNVRVRNVRVTPGGRYLFVDISISRKATAGRYRFTVQTPLGLRTDFAFDLASTPATRIAPLAPNDALYHLMPDRFSDGNTSNNQPKGAESLYNPNRPRHFHGGDLRGIEQKLGYLKDLGVTAIWMTPIYKNAAFADPNRLYSGEPVIDYHLYGAVDFYTIDPHLGTHADLLALMKAAHRLGLKVLQDQVCNHTGPFHPWTKNPPTPTWLNPQRDNTWQLLDAVSPAASGAMRDGVLRGWFAGFLPDINQDDADCATYLIQNAMWWVGTFGFDSIRQDTIAYVSATFWKQWSHALHKEFPGITLLGEVLDGNAALVSRYQKGQKGFGSVDAGFDTLFDFPSYFALHNSIASGDWRGLANILAHDMLYTDASALVTFAGLHDTPRLAGRAGYDEHRVVIALTVALTLRGIPMIYSGDEIGMIGGDDPDNRRHFPGGFAVDRRSAFEGRGRTARENKLHFHVRTLLRLRQQEKSLRTGRISVLVAELNGFVFIREERGENPVLVAVSTKQEWEGTVVNLPAGMPAYQWKSIFNQGSLESNPKQARLTYGTSPVMVFVGTKIVAKRTATLSDI